MRDNSGKIILALLAGASAGVVAGLLMAPDTGEVTRTGVKKWASKLSKDLEKNLQTGLDEIKNMSGDMMDNLNKKASALTGNGGADSGSTASGKSSGASSSGSSASGTGSSTSGAGSSGAGSSASGAGSSASGSSASGASGGNTSGSGSSSTGSKPGGGSSASGYNS